MANEGIAAGGNRDARATRWGLGIFGFALLVGLAMVLVVFRAQSLVDDAPDPYYFGEMGKSVARGEPLSEYGTLLHRRSPMYPLFIGAVYSVFGENPMAVYLLQCLLMAGTCWLVFDMGRRVFNLRTGILAGAMCALHPLMVRYVGDLHLETLLSFLFTLVVWCSVRFYEKPNVANGIWFGLIGGAAALTKAVVLLYPGLFVAAMLALRFILKKRVALPSVAAIAVIPLMMLLVISPWTYRNYQVTGKFVLITTGFNDAFLRGYIFSEKDYALLRRPPYTDAENASNAYFQSLAEKAGTVWERDDYETEQILGVEVKRKLKEEPGEFVRKFTTGLFTFWYQMTSLANSLLAGVCALGAWILVLLGVRRAWREDRPLWMFLLPGLHLNFLLAILLALGRYSAPIMPALLVASAFGIDTVLSGISARRSAAASRA
jgi:4-amino-4-deoxy-L-arabinose transferase-like glycosyltransferase